MPIDTISRVLSRTARIIIGVPLLALVAIWAVFYYVAVILPLRLVGSGFADDAEDEIQTYKDTAWSFTFG